MKIVSWNVENLKPLLVSNSGGLPEILERFDHPDILCLQEVRLRPQDTDLVDAMRVALPGYDCHYALCHDPKNVSFRGGRAYGVATYLRTELESAVLAPPEWEREGRVVVSLLEDQKLAILNLYAVNGTSKPYYDHELGRIDGDRHTFKRRFNANLFDHARTLRKAGFEVILIGDFNISQTKLDTYPRLRTEEPHATARRLFREELIPSLDVVDVFRELHPETRKYTWFNRLARAGTLDAARVDFALVSRSLLSRVLEADIDEAPTKRAPSDHAPLWLRLKI